ncbi:B3 domain-containing protein Os03g0619600 isoform X1 [Spinacia oleracea]|uniref:B3 domain-containing protein Os03g0619600 isoform X1 n=1 Tax=Spinacia oleracea TaxID=3562 RepID=A0A9R0JX14_SPIOL|nr:B3 domain-containing protein Os03g0619600-like isoform X1 [Spinacia oleracea]XP_056699760.1 B3 domain-containing protein Os03g0619600-like isoform X1 [Spinacia oleracea]
MTENSECSYCKTWEEEMYWKHFNLMHFLQILTPNFHDHLVLPEKFTAHMKAHLPDKVSLKGPSGAKWEIELLKAADDILFVGDGWKDFVKVNKLKENYVLVLKFNRNSSFEVLIFDQETSCEKEISYFVKKCSHVKSDNEVQKKTIAREASTEIIGDDEGEKDSGFEVSKKSKKDDQVVAFSEQVNTQASRKRGPSKARGKPTRILPCRLPVKRKFQSGKKSLGNETAKEPIEISQRDMLTPENGESIPAKGHSDRLVSHSKKSVNIAKKVSQNSRTELIPPENGENSATADHSEKSKGQSEEHVAEEQPSGNHIANEPKLISEMDFDTTENEESFRARDHLPKLKPQSEMRPSSNGTSKEPRQVVEKELIAPENGKNFPETDCSNGFKGQAEKEPSGRRGIVKEPSPVSGRKVIRPNYKDNSSEEDHSSKSRGKRGRPKKQVLPISSKKLEFRSVSDERKFSKEYMSNRRPVTEEEKEQAVQRANQIQTENSFIAIMRPSSVYNRFFLNIPAKWMQQHLPYRKQRVILRVGERKWHTSLFVYAKGAGISAGWKKFALDNFLEEFDVLVFNVVSQEDEIIVVMDVDICRVVQKVVPPLPLIS